MWPSLILHPPSLGSKMTHCSLMQVWLSVIPHPWCHYSSSLSPSPSTRVNTRVWLPIPLDKSRRQSNLESKVFINGCLSLWRLLLGFALAFYLVYIWFSFKRVVSLFFILLLLLSILLFLSCWCSSSFIYLLLILCYFIFPFIWSF